MGRASGTAQFRATMNGRTPAKVVRMTEEFKPLDYAAPDPAAARVPLWERVVIWLMVAALLLPVIGWCILYLVGVPIDD